MGLVRLRTLITAIGLMTINLVKQGVALTGRNTTGPPRAAPWCVTLHMRRVTDDADRRQTPVIITSLAPTLCVSGPVITCLLLYCDGLSKLDDSKSPNLLIDLYDNT